jgi:hypothetical protein
MLEALVNKPDRRVIVVAPAGKAWSDFERSFFDVVPWEDAALGEATDVVIEPYTTYDEDGAMTGATKYADR